jgi:hypothetical protein
MNLTVTPHHRADVSLLHRIAVLKSKAWPFTVEEHISWMEKNTNDNDLHVFLTNKEGDLAYLCLIPTEVFIDGIPRSGYGVGNVCAGEKGKGHGLCLMLEVNALLNEANRVGLLFCRQHNVPFYNKCGWQLVSPAALELTITNGNIDTQSVYTFLYGGDDKIKKICYVGKVF